MTSEVRASCLCLALVLASSVVGERIASADDSAIPSDWNDMIKLGGDIAGEVTGVSGAVDFTQRILTMTGFIGAPQDPIKAMQDAINAELDRIYGSIHDDSLSARRRDISTQVGLSQAARTHVIEWVHRNPNTPLQFFSPPDNNSLVALSILKQDGYWLRPWDDRTYRAPAGVPSYYDFFQKAVTDRAPLEGGLVWDYRLVLSALVDAITNRLEVIAAIDAGFAGSDDFVAELTSVKTFLQAVHDKMLSGIRCGSHYEMVPGSGYPDYWYVIAGCGDIYTGATSYQTYRWQDGYQPDYSWVQGYATQLIANARAAMPGRIGIPQLERLIDKLDRYGNFAIGGVRDDDGAGPLHYVELYGSFPGATHMTAHVSCNGAEVSQYYVNIVYASRGQINVSFPEQNQGSACMFWLVRDGDRGDDTVSPSHTASQTYGPVWLHPPVMQINGVRYAGLSGGRRYFELYGSFPDYYWLSPSVTCDWGWRNATIEWAGSNQVNVSIPDPTTFVQNCSFALIRGRDGRQSPVYGPFEVDFMPGR